MWRTVKLDDGCKIINGGTPKSKVSEYWDGDVQWLTPKDMGKLKSRHVSETERRISQKGLANSSAKLIPQNAVILSCRAPIGHVAINRIPMSFNQGCKGLVPSADLLVEYLYYFLISSKQLLNDLGTGTTFKEISGKTLATVDVPLPPLSEQQRIVAKLDAAFAEIDRAAELVAAKTKQAALLRQAAIDRLIENKAVASQPLRDAIEIKHGFAFRSEFFEQTGELVLLTPGNFEEEGGYRDRGEKQKYYVGECPDEFVMKGGELLVAMTEQAKGLLGSSIIVPEDGVYLHNQRLGKVQPKQPLSLAWLFHYFNTSMVREELHRTGTGLKVRHTSPAKIGDLEIKVPSIDEQNRVAHILDNVIAEQKNLFAYYQAQTEEMSALKSAILAQELQPPQSEAA